MRFIFSSIKKIAENFVQLEIFPNFALESS